MDSTLIGIAKTEAKARGKSVSKMVSDFIDSLGCEQTKKDKLPPVTSSLVGLLKNQQIDENSYKNHLREKHL
jgi:hypothetical protein